MSEEPEWECLSCAAMGCSFFDQLARPLHKKLAIAVDALEYYASQDNGLFADKALKKIGEA